MCHIVRVCVTGPMKKALRETQALRALAVVTSKVRSPPARHKQTQTGPITIHCAANYSAQCKNLGVLGCRSLGIIRIMHDPVERRSSRTRANLTEFGH